MEEKTHMISANVEIQKGKEIKKAINKSLNLIVAQNTPIEQIVKKSYELLAYGLSVSNGAIYCHYEGMDKGAVVRASNMANDVLKGFYPTCKAQTSKIAYLVGINGQVKISSVNFLYRQATGEEIKALELAEMPKVEGIKDVQAIQANKTDVKTAVMNK